MDLNSERINYYMLAGFYRYCHFTDSGIAGKLGTWELYGGYGYHFAGQDGKAEYNQYQGFKPGAGIIKHFGRTLIATAGISGKVATLQIGIFTIK